MDYKEKETLISRITSGVYIFLYGREYYYIDQPTPRQAYMADMIYDKSFKDSLFDNLLTKEEALLFLEEKGLWSPSYEEDLKKFNEDLDELKLKLYKAFLRSDEERDFIRDSLSLVRKNIYTIERARVALDHTTREGFAAMSKIEFLITCTLRKYLDDSLIFDGANDDRCSKILETATVHLSRQRISSEKIREISRTEPWRSIWTCKKADAFPESPHLTEEQKTLIIYSKMYDSAFEHPECPDDDILNNDDMFDGWMIYQRREREKKKTRSKVQGMIGKQGDKEDVFIVVPDAKEAQKINKLNDTKATMIKRQRELVISNLEKDVTDLKFQDRKQQVYIESMRQHKESAR